MTTFDPGASVVLTHGLLESPFSTAFLASSAAPIITYGFEVFVHDVIAAMTTAPWSSVIWVPSSNVVVTGLDGRVATSPTLQGIGASAALDEPTATGSLAGNVSSIPSSSPPVTVAA